MLISQNLFKNNQGSTLLMITILVLTATITVTLNAAEIIRLGVIKGRTQVYSTQAYFAAEAGAEKILYFIRDLAPSFTIETCADNFCVVFDAAGSPVSCDANCTQANKFITLGNEATYYIKYRLDGGTNVITSYGAYKDVTRAIELRY